MPQAFAQGHLEVGQVRAASLGLFRCGFFVFFFAALRLLRFLGLSFRPISLFKFSEFSIFLLILRRFRAEIRVTFCLMQ